MDYVPWPEVGCNLLEARERTADRRAWLEWINARTTDRDAPQASALERDISRVCASHFVAGKLATYGRRSEAEPPDYIDPHAWSGFQLIDWEGSRVRASGSDFAFIDVRVFPVVHAPCRARLVAGTSLAEAFQRFIIQDPEVAALVRSALEVAPQFETVFVRGHCFVHGTVEWPVSLERWEAIGYVHPDQDKRGALGFFDDPDPVEVMFASEALLDRYHALILMLRRQEISARALPRAGPPETLLHSIWSHEDYFINANTGDILVPNEDFDHGVSSWVTRRWSATVLEPTVPFLFHGKPTASDQLRLDATTPKIPAGNSRVKVETSSKAYKECVDWLCRTFAASRDTRLQTRDQLWKTVREKWPSKISERSFDEARREAIRKTGATAWGAAGAPKKSKQ